MKFKRLDASNLDFMPLSSTRQIYPPVTANLETDYKYYRDNSTGRGVLDVTDRTLEISRLSAAAYAVKPAIAASFAFALVAAAAMIWLGGYPAIAAVAVAGLWLVLSPTIFWMALSGTLGDVFQTWLHLRAYRARLKHARQMYDLRQRWQYTNAVRDAGENGESPHTCAPASKEKDDKGAHGGRYVGALDPAVVERARAYVLGLYDRRTGAPDGDAVNLLSSREMPGRLQCVHPDSQAADLLLACKILVPVAHGLALDIARFTSVGLALRRLES